MDTTARERNTPSDPSDEQPTLPMPAPAAAGVPDLPTVPLAASIVTSIAASIAASSPAGPPPPDPATPRIQLRNLGNALGGASLKRGNVWRYWPDDNKGITQGPDITLSGGGSTQTLTSTFPVYSITLLRLEV